MFHNKKMKFLPKNSCLGIISPQYNFNVSIVITTIITTIIITIIIIIIGAHHLFAARGSHPSSTMRSMIVT